jgi:hypothetical protein
LKKKRKRKSTTFIFNDLYRSNKVQMGNNGVALLLVGLERSKEKLFPCGFLLPSLILT